MRELVKKEEIIQELGELLTDAPETRDQCYNNAIGVCIVAALLDIRDILKESLLKGE